MPGYSFSAQPEAAPLAHAAGLADPSIVLLYRVYGILLGSDVTLPELLPAPINRFSREPDLAVALKAKGGPKPGRLSWSMLYEGVDGNVWTLWAKDERGYFLRFPKIADFWMSSAGDRITCIGRAAATSSATLRHLLIDQILPAALSIRGGEALHATAVLTPHGLCAFTGPSGAGKSTLAASFMLTGYRSFGDDCLALQALGKRIFGAPAYPGVRLWNDSLRSLARRGTLPPRLSRVAHYTSKQRAFDRESAARFPVRAQPLTAIYRVVRVPASSSDRPVLPAIEPLSTRDALVELVNASYRLDLANRELLTREFRFLERVARSVPMRRLHVPDDFASLPAVRSAVLADLARL